MYCPKCGNEIKPGERSCSECGSKAGIPAVTQEIFTSVGGWLGWWALFMLVPVVGWVLAICLTKDQNVKNGLLAYLLLGVIAIAVLIVLSIMGAVSIFSR